MRTITLKDLRLYGHHGLLPAEAVVGQEFIVDITAHVDFGPAAHSDDFELTMDYGQLTELAVRFNQSHRFDLIETFADRLAQEVLDTFTVVSRVQVTLRKPNAPIPADFAFAAVHIDLPRAMPFSLSLGANQGAMIETLQAAMMWLDLEPGVTLTGRSAIYRTPPWGKTDQAWFANAGVIGTTTLSPKALLRVCKTIEMNHGRMPGERWGPRALDIDIVTFGDLTLDTPSLKVPHPRAAERGFVLVPLAEIAAEWTLNGRSFQDLADACDRTGIEVL